MHFTNAYYPNPYCPPVTNDIQAAEFAFPPLAQSVPMPIPPLPDSTMFAQTFPIFPQGNRPISIPPQSDPMSSFDWPLFSSWLDTMLDPPLQSQHAVTVPSADCGPEQIVSMPNKDSLQKGRSAKDPSARKHRRRTENPKRRSEQQRREYLQNDKFTLSFTKTTVTCAKCGKVIKLDGRDGARYYLGFWIRHKKSCSDGEEP